MILKQFPGCKPAFLSHVSQKKVNMKKRRMGLDKGVPEIKIGVQRVKDGPTERL